MSDRYTGWCFWTDLSWLIDAQGGVSGLTCQTDRYIGWCFWTDLSD